MCTAVSWNGSEHYFGRNLDLHHSYGESVVITPRNFPFLFRNGASLTQHFGIIGVATVVNGYPLYYDATNEKGLSIAGLNFPVSAFYPEEKSEHENIAPFELIPWILGQCSSVDEAAGLLENINLVNTPFSEDLPLTPLHWIISDAVRSITVESTADGLHIYPNEIGILTNEPPFDYHCFNLQNYLHLGAAPAENRFCPGFPLNSFSNGSGSFGLPGDFTSASRFIRAAFVKLNSYAGSTEDENISQFFHILDSVAMPKGCVQMPSGEFEITRYSSCCNTRKGSYYYTTYDNRQITRVDMHQEDLDQTNLISYPLLTSGAVIHQN